MKQYKINEETLRDLLACEHTLDALEAGGVKNWEWYEESLSRSDVLDVEEALKEFDIVDLEQENVALKSELAKCKEALEELNNDLIWIEIGGWNDSSSQIKSMQRKINKALIKRKEK